MVECLKLWVDSTFEYTTPVWRRRLAVRAACTPANRRTKAYYDICKETSWGQISVFWRSANPDSTMQYLKNGYDPSVVWKHTFQFRNTWRAASSIKTTFIPILCQPLTIRISSLGHWKILLFFMDCKVWMHYSYACRITFYIYGRTFTIQ